MGIDDRIENAKDEAVGQAKQKVGEATDDRSMQAEGAVQEGKGKLGQKVEDLKDKMD